MPEGITLKRIIDMDEATELSSSDYALVDSATGGPKKFALGEELSSLKEDYTTILDSAYVTDTASGSIASFPDGADNVPVKSLKVAIEPVQSGSGDPSPDNVRPISGHTQAVATRTGVNVWDEEWELGGINADTGSNVTGTTQIRSKNYIPVKPGMQLYIKAPNQASSSAGNLQGRYYDSNKQYLGYNPATEVGKVLTVPDNCYYIRFACQMYYGTTYNNDISINYPATDTDYHEGHAQTVTIDLGDTIYGGTLDVGTGVLTVDRQIVDLGTLNWTQSNTAAGAPYPHRWFSNAVSNMSGSATTANGLCNKYATVPYSGGSADPNVILNGQRDYVCSSEARGYINVIDSAKDSLTPAQFKSAMDGTYIVYKLANPFEVTLTANEITTLLGQNNIWSDAGNVDVEYRADTKLYIEKLTAPTEDDMVADHAISANSFFMVGNTLYRATTAIASGATITVGTNATKLSLSEALNALA